VNNYTSKRRPVTFPVRLDATHYDKEYRMTERTADTATGWAAAWADAASVIDTIDYVIGANRNASPGELIPVITEIIRDWHDRKPRPATGHTAEALALIHEPVWPHGDGAGD
jgi:hypothetical protein